MLFWVSSAHLILGGESYCATASSEAGLAGMPEACPAPASWLFLLWRGDQPWLSTQFCSPPKTPHHHPEVHHMPPASTSRRHMHCQPLWLKANDFRKTSRHTHEYRKTSRPTHEYSGQPTSTLPTHQNYQIHQIIIMSENRKDPT